MGKHTLKYTMWWAFVAWAPGSAASQTTQPYTFEAQVRHTVEAELGEFTVPENRAAPGARSIAIRYMRLASRAERPGSPIVYLAGGPGGAGTQAMRGQRWLLFDRLRDVADVIILDQRGTGLSDEVPGCDSSVEIPFDRPATRAVLIDSYEAAFHECLEVWRDAGIDIRGYTTWESAADIDALREALGVPRVSLLGISYGTHLALATLKRYPTRVDRLVLASAEGLEHTVKLPSRTDAYFERLQVAIDADPASRALYPDVRGLIASVLDQVERDPPTLLADDDPEFYHTLGRFEVQIIAGSMLADPARLPSMLRGFSRAAGGNYIWFENYLDRIVGDNRISLNGMAEVMDIASGISPDRRARVEAEAETALLGDALGFPMPQLAQVVPDVVLDQDFRDPVESDRPALFLSGTLDGRTYPESHAEIRAGFANGGQVVIENAGHNLFFSHPEVVELVARFFGGAPARDQTLQAELPTFVPDGGR